MTTCDPSELCTYEALKWILCGFRCLLRLPHILLVYDVLVGEVYDTRRSLRLVFDP
jgi:hypothetical protein